MFHVRLLLASIAMTVCFATFASGALKLPDDEVQALHDILNTLGKKDWDFISNPCNSTGLKEAEKLSKMAAVICSSCTYVNGTESYGVVGIIIKRQSLSGTLPLDLKKLPCLQVLDLSFNYLNGSIPSTWGVMPQLTNIGLSGNRLTGRIPGTLANIKTLKILAVGSNYLYGNLPPELGNMSSIEIFGLTSNYFTGELPSSFANLTSLKDFRINDNQFSGQIPSYILKWKSLNTLFIQASGLKGPIPRLDGLENLSDLEISDLNGSEVTFPLKNINVSQWKVLILRNCNLTGPLPNPILSNSGERKLKTLDLSFNRLSGKIPDNFGILLRNVERIYLTGNLFTGQIPDWILHGGKNVDLSYNNFTIDEGSKLPSSNCQYEDGINFFASSSMDNIETGNIVSCLRSLQRSCPKDGRYKLHINCGGQTVTVNKSIEFDADNTNLGRSSKFFLAQDRYWSFSSTGIFMIDDNRPIKEFILSNLSRLYTNTSDTELYMEARFSPLSLTYYAFCLVSGNYTVKLHFAEIVFTDDETYNSLGRRIFDVYIQEERVLKDFDIVKAAGGVRKPNTQTFNDVIVTNSTLEIRFYWAGKGTTDVPSRGDYGPLISAISVNSHVEPPSISRGISTGAVVGIIVAGAFVVIFFVMATLWWKGCLGQRSSTTDRDIRDLDLKTGTFTLRQIKTATNNFDAANKIGEGGFGSVYKGLLSDGTMIAVKQLSSKSKQGNREFLNEIGMISALQHPHLVKLYGCCVEENQLSLVYEYMENNSLARALFGKILSSCT